MDEATPVLVGNNILSVILESLGWGKFQWIVLFLTGIAYLSDGAEVTVLSILSSTLEKEWHLDAFKMGLMTGIVFAGQIIGNLIVGVWGDDVGRLKLLKISAIILLVFGLLSAAMPEFWSFTIMRGLTGIGIGFIGAVSTAYSSETTPLDQRGLSLIISTGFFNLGQVYVALLALALLPDMDPTYWRLLLVLTGVPILLYIGMVFYYAVESPYFLAIHERYEEAIDSLNVIAQTNLKPELSDEEKALLKTVPFKSESVGLGKIGLLFTEDKSYSTILVTVLWFLGIFTYYSMLFIVPKTIGADDGNFMIICILIIGAVQAPSQLVAIWTMEMEYIGRKHTMSLSLAGQALSAFISIFLVKSKLVLVPLAFYFMFSNLFTSIIYLYAAELYETRIRAMALCFFNVFARFGGVIGPGLYFVLHEEYGDSAPYICTVVASIIAFAVCLLLPYETRNKVLDT
jgi:putative MFS transporter